jgi:anthranilate synthase component II
MQHVLLINNYDSFTYNLVQILRESGLCTYEVVYNDAFEIDDGKHYDKILISPGPGLPAEAGITCDVIRRWASEKSILGVCLGHQAIGIVFGATLEQLPHPNHGLRQMTEITEPQSSIFKGLPSSIETGHYHSWVLDNKNFPSALNVTARNHYGHIMAISHVKYNVHGVQFHPESLMTHHGVALIRNWLSTNLFADTGQ